MRPVACFNVGLLVPILGLIGISLSLIASTTPTFFVNQLVFFLLGFLLYIVFASIDFRLWIRFRWLFYLISLIFLSASFFGPEIRGAHRWIEVGIWQVQPSEVIKPFIIMVLAATLTLEKTSREKSLFWASVLLLPVLILIFKQPDLGNVIVYFFTFAALSIMSGLPLVYILLGLVFFILILPGLWSILAHYQKNRLLAFINPAADPMGVGYNALQAVIAIGSGQFFGRGLGRGTQSHLLFLPEYRTDFVFASVGEELGFLGGALIILFFFLLLGSILRISTQSNSNFGKLVTIGIFAQLFIQVFINIGMNLGLVPVTGITLPLVSSGGSSIISTFIGLGLVSSVDSLNKKNPLVIG